MTTPIVPPCGSQYTQTGRVPNTRIVECDLVRGHGGCHWETSSGSTWPIEEPADRGICGADAPTLVQGGGFASGICTLLAGHAGWHRGDNGMSWTERDDAPRVGTNTPATFNRAYEAGYERGVAEGRRQATEGWRREWGVQSTDGGHVSVEDDEATARRVAGLWGAPYVAVSRLVGPWEAAEQTRAPEPPTWPYGSGPGGHHMPGDHMRHKPTDPPKPLYPRFAPDAKLVVDIHNGHEQWTGAEWNEHVEAAERSQRLVTARLVECPPRAAEADR